MKSRLTVLLMLFISCSLFPRALYANQERLVLKYHDSHFQGGRGNPARVNVKEALRSQFPGLRVKKLSLKKVIVMAKSRHGRGTVSLGVGQQQTRSYQVGGTPHGFNNGGKQSFDKIMIANPSGGSHGQWNLFLHGNLVVRKVVVVAERHHFQGEQWRDDDRHPSSPHPGFHPGAHQSPKKPRWMQLHAGSWGTEWEGEKRCGQGSDNTRDGWDSPQNVCSSGGMAAYRRGYQAVRLFIRPDVRGLNPGHGFNRISAIKVRVDATAQEQDLRGHESATLGIEISGQTYRQRFPLGAGGRRNGGNTLQNLLVQGNWSLGDLESAKVWVRPDQDSVSLAVRQLVVAVAGH